MRKGLAQGVAQGVAQARREAIRRIGTKRFGPMPMADVAELEAVNDAERLDRLIDRLLDAASWDDLLDTP